MLEKESLLINLSKNEILARTRAARICELEKTLTILQEKLLEEENHKKRLQIELDDSIAVLEETLCVNKALKRENESVRFVQEQFLREKESSKRFEALYLDLLKSTRETQKIYIGHHDSTQFHDQQRNIRNESVSIQTDSLLTLAKYSQVDSKHEFVEISYSRDG